MNEAELTKKFQFFEKQINALQEEISAINTAIDDMKKISLGLEELRGKTGEEIFAQIGKGLYVKAKLLDETILLNTGRKNFVKKSIDEAKLIIKKQEEKFESIKKEVEEDLQKIDAEVEKTMKEFNKENSK